MARMPISCKRPHRALARRPAAEIRPVTRISALPIGLAVKDEVGVFRAIWQIAQRAERPLAERAANRVADQPLDPNDHVGVDILRMIGAAMPLQLGEASAC